MRRWVPLVFILAVSCSHVPVRLARSLAVTPVGTPTATISLETPRPTPGRLPPPTERPAAVAEPAPRNPLTTFEGLGSWSDVYDYRNDPASIVPLVRTMAAHGVRVLYVETSRSRDAADIAYPRALGAAVDTAKELGMRVVGWYPPELSNVSRDLRRSRAAIEYRSPAGHRFDAFGADIEFSTVKNPDERNRRVAIYSRDLRRIAGRLPLAAIVYPPTQIERRPGIWPGYPWRTFGKYYDIVMAMHYWTFHASDPKSVFATTVRNSALIRALTGRPAHVIGGLAADATAPEVAAYTTGAIESGSIGGSLYDGRTTSLPQWVRLAPLNR